MQMSFTMLIIEAWIEMFRTFIEINIKGKPLIEVLSKSSTHSRRSSLDLGDLSKSIRYANYLLPIRITCLIQSLAASRILAKRNYDNKLRIAAYKENQKINFHAWTVSDSFAITSGPVIGNYEILLAQTISGK